MWRLPQGKAGKPLRQLAAYAKTEELKPGASEELILKAELTELASHDDSGVTGHKSCYVLEAGDYIFYVGTDAECKRSRKSDISGAGRSYKPLRKHWLRCRHLNAYDRSSSEKTSMPSPTGRMCPYGP